MWGRRARADREPFTYLHRGTVVEGDLRVQGRLRVDGAVHGDVRADGPVEVSAEGSVTAARIEGSDVRILGDVRGDVHASGTVRIWRGGRLTGDVYAATLDIEEGATFTGRSHMPEGEDAPAGDEADGPTRSALTALEGTADGA